MDLAVALARHIDARMAGTPRLVVGVDGPDCAGKTTLADAVVRHLPGRVIRAGADSFQHPRARRHRRGPFSPEGYYHDAFQIGELRSLLAAFAEGADRVRAGVFDLVTDAPRADWRRVPDRACALVVDGVFLQRPALRDRWDLTIYLHVTAETILARALVRDAARFDDADTLTARYRARYLPGQELYRRLDDPIGRAHVVVDMTRPEAPAVLRDDAGVIAR